MSLSRPRYGLFQEPDEKLIYSVDDLTARIMFRRKGHGTSLCFSTAGSQADSLSILPCHHGIASGPSAPEYSRFLLLTAHHWTYSLGFSLTQITSSLCGHGNPELHRHTHLSLDTVFLHSVVFLLHFSHFSALPLRHKNSDAYQPEEPWHYHANENKYKRSVRFTQPRRTSIFITWVNY